MITAESLPFLAIAQAVGTPYYCYSADQIRQRLRKLKTALPDGITYLYSLKANPNKSIVEVLRAEGTGCEVCSLAELETALAAGVAPHDIVFVGPGKSSEELRRCVELGIKAVIVESLAEMAGVQNLAAARGRVQPIGLRINPFFKSTGAKLVMSGRPTQFGIDEDQLSEALLMLRHSRHVVLAGLHVYMGSRILDVAAITENTRNILDLAVRIQELGELSLAFVDVGGGLGVRYFDGEADLDVSALGAALRGSVERFARRCPSTRIIIELGRYLVAQAGIFVTAVRYVKRSKGKLFAICDGGSNCHGAAAGLGSIFRRNYPIATLSGTSHRRAVYTLTGPLCTPTDVIGEDVALGELAVGDLIGIFHSGAYGPSASPVQFLGFGHPAEVIVDGGLVRLIRRRDSVEEALSRQVAVPIEVGPVSGSLEYEIAETRDH